ncbi:MAG: hypothetical protein ACX94C_10280 [Phycisphaerales bacterium]
MREETISEMRCMGIILSLGTIAAGASAQHAIVMGDDEGVALPSVLFDRGSYELNERVDQFLMPITAEELTELRASGIDPSWISERFDLPTFDPTLRRVTQDDHPLYVESWATHHSNSKPVMKLDRAFSFKVGRTTALRDGNIAGSKGGFGNGGSDHVASIAQSEGEYDLYDLSVQWDAVDTGDVALSFLSGVKAIDANIGKRVEDASGSTSIDSQHRAILMPMVGSGVRWNLSDDLSISGSALTHPIESGEALIDFNAATDLRITRNVDFTAGYRIIRSTFDVGSVTTELTQEGLFARLQIRF